MTDKRSVSIEVRHHGGLIGVFASVRIASRVLRLNEKKLSDVLRGHQEHTGDGYSARYFSQKNYEGG